MHFYEKINYILNFSNYWDDLNINQNFKIYTGITTYAHQNFSRGPFIFYFLACWFSSRPLRTFSFSAKSLRYQASALCFTLKTGFICKFLATPSAC